MIDEIGPPKAIAAEDHRGGESPSWLVRIGLLDGFDEGIYSLFFLWTLDLIRL